MFDRSRLPPLNEALLCHTADMLALPLHACSVRECRRARRCSFFYRDDRQPCCVDNLETEQRRLFDAFAELVRDVRDYSTPASKLLFASRWRGEREMQDAAVAVARSLLAGRRLRSFRAFEALRAKEPPPWLDGFPPD
ncbi:hypothetical protein [Sinorhizobium sp. RAC02]|uniref:hypothetical protein n=1 Tax=Sinorhizobium sp. RAC02 TaxID=1842534 RepID=UPI00083DAEAD|nr:hypothetical protein [Sinorhizobium sp. RAC02]AOF90178.1 hypothetical protein BSY16_1409 [Sinorhizobium sp. RAC02]